MNSKVDTAQSSPDFQIQEALSLIDSGKDPVAYSPQILGAIESCATKVSSLLQTRELKNSYALLTSIQNLCLKILRKLASNPKSEFVASIKRALEAFDHYQNQSKKVYSSLDDFLVVLEAHANSIVFKEHKANAEFYLAICFDLIQSVNNIGIVLYLNKKPEQAIRNFYCAAEVFRALERLVNPFQIFSLTTVLINVSLISESQATLEIIGKILCGAILFLENLEEAIDKFNEDSGRYYDKLRIQTNFACVSEVEAKNSQNPSDFLQGKSIITSRMVLLYNYYAKILQDLGKQQEADFAEDQAKLLYKQLEQQESQESERTYGKQKSKLTTDNIKKITESNADRNAQKGDTASNFSVKTGGSFRTSTSEIGKLSKENIIYHKYVEAGAMKFKIVMAQIQELNSIQIIVYSKAKGLLKKIYLHFEDLIQFAVKSDSNAMRDEREFTKLLSSLAKLLYFKEGELFLREIKFFRSLEELAGSQQAAQ